MHSRITSALVKECSTDRILEIKPSPQINFLQGRDSEGFLLALAGLFGGLPGNCFQSGEEYEVKAHVVWTDNLTCELGANFSKEEKRVCVNGVKSAYTGTSVQALQRVKAIHKRRFQYGTNTAHIFDNTSRSGNCELLGEGDETLRRFSAFLEKTRLRSALGDTRPLFLYHLLERLDEAVDLQPIFEALNASGRQVFIAVPHYYKIEKLEGTEYDASIHDESNL